MLHFLQQLFQRRGAAAAIWQPVGEPTPEQAQQHQAWVAERVYQNWLGPYFKAYHLRKGGAGGRRGLRVELLREDGRQGGLFFYDDSIGPGNFSTYSSSWVSVSRLWVITALATTAASASMSSTTN